MRSSSVQPRRVMVFYKNECRTRHAIFESASWHDGGTASSLSFPSRTARDCECGGACGVHDASVVRHERVPARGHLQRCVSAATSRRPLGSDASWWSPAWANASWWAAHATDAPWPGGKLKSYSKSRSDPTPLVDSAIYCRDWLRRSRAPCAQPPHRTSEPPAAQAESCLELSSP
jgi:hypothetical protein